MKKVASGLVFLLCLNASGQQVEFTAAEGYKSKALNGQNGWDASPGWMVDANGGTVSATKVFQKAVLTGHPVVVSPGGSVLVWVAFQLLGTPARSYTGISQQVFDAVTSGGVEPYFSAQTFDVKASGVSGIQVDSIQVYPGITMIVG